MSKKNVFLYDIDVPEIVQEKAEYAFSLIRSEGEIAMKEQRNIRKKTKRNHKKSNVIGILLSAAACAAVVVMAGHLVWSRNITEIADKESAADEIMPNEGVENENDILAALDNMFTLQVMAAELEEGQPVPLVENTPATGNDSQISEKHASSWVLDGTEDGGVDYCIQFPVSCTGNNVDSITYSINNGAFQIVQPADDSIILDGELYNGALNVGQIGERWDEETGKTDQPYEIFFYKSFTVDYQRQNDEDTWINICNELPGRSDLKELIWGDGNSLEEINQGMQGMFDNTVINCTVRYTDGTSQSAGILVNSRIMTCAEAGAEIKEDPNREEIFITFELQKSKQD